MTRAEVLAIVEAAGAISDDDANDPDWLTIGTWGMELRFGEKGEQHLRQIALDDASWHWGGKPLLGEPLHRALEALGPAARDAAWRPENAVDHQFDDLEAAEPGACYDEPLLDGGTLWLPARRLGLVMQHGHVKELAWRGAEDIPRKTVSGVTEAQLQLSRRKDLEHYLRTWRPHRGMTPGQLLLTVLFMMALIGTAVFAFQEQQAWRSAPTAMATVTAVDPLPAGIGQKPIHVEFTDEGGKRQQASLETAEFYSHPNEAGEQVEIRYLPTEPVQVKGPARAQDAAFVRYVPVVLVITAIYGALMALLRSRRVRAGSSSSAETLA
jgi:hypothetical protein